MNNNKELIDLIEQRILTEQEKHSKSMPDEWARIAAAKIIAGFKEHITAAYEQGAENEFTMGGISSDQYYRETYKD